MRIESFTLNPVVSQNYIEYVSVALPSCPEYLLSADVRYTYISKSLGPGQARGQIILVTGGQGGQQQQAYIASGWLDGGRLVWNGRIPICFPARIRGNIVNAVAGEEVGLNLVFE